MLILKGKVQLDDEWTLSETCQDVSLSLGILSQILLKNELLVNDFHGELDFLPPTSRHGGCIIYRVIIFKLYKIDITKGSFTKLGFDNEVIQVITVFLGLKVGRVSNFLLWL